MACTIVLYFLFPVRRKELDDATGKLIKTLQETVGALERDLNEYKAKTLKLETQQIENISKISAIESEKKLLSDFIAGRDKATSDFQASCMKVTAETHEIVKSMALSLEKNNTKTKDFVETMRQHILNVEKSTLK